MHNTENATNQWDGDSVHKMTDVKLPAKRRGWDSDHAVMATAWEEGGSTHILLKSADPTEILPTGIPRKLRLEGNPKQTTVFLKDAPWPANAR